MSADLQRGVQTSEEFADICRGMQTSRKVRTTSLRGSAHIYRYTSIHMHTHSHINTKTCTSYKYIIPRHQHTFAEHKEGNKHAEKRHEMVKTVKNNILVFIN